MIGICCNYGAGAVNVEYDGNPVLEGGAFGGIIEEEFGGSCGVSLANNMLVMLVL